MPATAHQTAQGLLGTHAVGAGIVTKKSSRRESKGWVIQVLLEV